MLWQAAMKPAIALFPLMLDALSLPGCATSRDYPSLARREVERIAGAAEPVAPPAAEPAPAVPADADTLTRIRALVARAEAANRRFTGERGAAERLVSQAAGSAMASESWSVALAALAGLEAARNDASLALTQIDELYVAERHAHYEDPTGNAKALAAARDSVTAMVEAQNRTVDALARRLGV